MYVLRSYKLNCYPSLASLVGHFLRLAWGKSFLPLYTHVQKSYFCMSVTSLHQWNYMQWNPSIIDTTGNQNFVRYRDVSLTQGVSGIFLVGVVCVIGLLSTAWLHFQSFAFARWP